MRSGNTAYIERLDHMRFFCSGAGVTVSFVAF
jgi:hypothetical protein